MSSPASPHLSTAASMAVLRIGGADAREFLHAQLTQDLRALEADAVCRAAWLDPQGRVLACFDVVAHDRGFDLLGPASLADTLAQRLRLFVLRASVTIERLDAITVVAITGATAPFLEQAGVPAGPDDPRHCRLGATDWVRIAPGLAIGYGVEPLAGGAVSDERAELAEIRLGRAQLDVATTGRFTAHMLNLDRTGAISFTKGCYPGQEIVARTEHRGEVRRRMFGFSTDARAAAGMTVTAADGTEVGSVVRAAAAGRGTELLAVVRCEAAGDALTLGADGAGLERLPVPGEP